MELTVIMNNRSLNSPLRSINAAIPRSFDYLPTNTEMLFGHFGNHYSDSFHGRIKRARHGFRDFTNQRFLLISRPALNDIKLSDWHGISSFKPGRDCAQALIANGDVVTRFDGNSRSDTTGHDEGAGGDMFSSLGQQIRQHGDA